MKITKKILMLVMAALMIFALCACGGEEEGGDALKGTWTKTTEYGETTISFNGKGDCEASWELDREMVDKGKYTIESDHTGTVKLDGWSEAQTFTFEVTETTLKITDNYSVFSGDFTKK